MKSAYGPTGPPKPVALKAGSLIQKSRSYRHLLMALGVVYLVFGVFAERLPLSRYNRSLIWPAYAQAWGPPPTPQNTQRARAPTAWSEVPSATVMRGGGSA